MRSIPEVVISAVEADPAAVQFACGDARGDRRVLFAAQQY